MALSVAIVIHECGHAVAMLAFGVQVKTLALGFGPLLWSHVLDGGTSLEFRLILLGGYTVPVPDGPVSMNTLSLPASLAVNLAGMFCNAVTGFAVYAWFLRRHLSGAAVWRTAFRESFTAWALYPWRTLRNFILTVRLKDVPKDNDVVAGLVKGMKGSRGSMVLQGAALLIGGISVGLAQFNFLPFAPLDGGQIFSTMIARTYGEEARGTFVSWALLTLMGLWLVQMFFESIRERRRRKRANEEFLRQLNAHMIARLSEIRREPPSGPPPDDPAKR